MKALIVYYTWSGQTEKIAKMIKKVTGGELCEIKPKVPYTEDYNKVVNQAKEELKKRMMPEIEETGVDLSSYDTIFVGTPNWWSSVAPPMQKYLSDNDFSGKTVYPFITHGGGGGGHIEKDIKGLCAGAELKRALVAYEGGVTLTQIEDWINGV